VKGVKGFVLKQGCCEMCGSGKHRTDEHAERAVAARLASNKWKTGLVAFNKRTKTGRPSWNKGIKGSVPGFSSDQQIEARRRAGISAGQKKVDHWWCRGKNNWHWKGTDYSKDNADFRRLRPIALDRDKNTCQQCGKTSKEVRIVVHHIDHDPSHNWLDNYICLCHPDNVRAEYKKYKLAWEKKFRKYTLAISYTISN
jgi:hypothetical protein